VPDWCLHHQIAHFARPTRGQIGTRLLFPSQASRADGRQTARLPFGDQIWARARAGQGPSLWQDMVSTSPFLTNNDMCRSSKYVLALDLGSHPSICSHGYPPPQKKQLYIYIYNVTRDLVYMGSVLKWIDNVIPAQGDGHTPQGMV
jgi:hypothetical protein